MTTRLEPGQTLVLGTKNPGKVKELTELFHHYGVSVSSLDDYPDVDLVDPEEVGVTFLDNALLKARYYAKVLGQPVLADDSGLCITALDYKPGVFTKRYFEDLGGYQKGFEALETILRQEGSAPYEASMHCVLVVAWSDGSYEHFEGICEGELTFPARYGDHDNGFGVDPIFQPRGHDKTFAEDLEYKHQVSHRKRALSQMIQYFFASTLSPGHEHV